MREGIYEYDMIKTKQNIMRNKLASFVNRQVLKHIQINLAT